MTETRNRLSLLFLLTLLPAAALYIGGEFLGMDIAWAASAADATRFITETVAILLSLAIVPLALRLFRLKRVQADLTSRKSPALLRWGTLRLLMLGAVLDGNALLYYLFGHEPAFGYLAVITLLVMPFVVPTMRRCLSETTPEPSAEAEKEEPAP